MSRGGRLGLVALLALAVAAGAWMLLRERTAHDAGVVLAGGDGGGLPRADAAAEGVDPQALNAAAQLAREQRARALLVMRHEHLILEQYGGGADAGTLIDGGEFAAALVALAAGVAHAQNAMPVVLTQPFDAALLTAAIARASGMDYPRFLSRNVWQPLDAAPARYLAPAATASTPEAGAGGAGEVSARALDWLRVGGLLLHDGHFEGTQVIPSGWTAQLRLPVPGGDDRRGWGVYRASAANGAEGYASDDVFFLRGPGATRLWLVPRLDLLILLVADAPRGSPLDETRLPNRVIRAVRDRPSTGGTSLDDLVPGH